jgi:type VI secretion system protein ImpG
MRELSVEFAREFPKVAARLTLDGFECADPYIERLIESFAFLSARVQLKLDADFPRFTQSLLETVYPHYLAPTPSMAVVQFQPDMRQGVLDAGFPVPRGAGLRSLTSRDILTPCRYATAHDITLHPVEIAAAEYHTRDLALLNLPADMNARAVLRLELRCPPGKKFEKIRLDRLVVYLRGVHENAMRIYEQVLAHGQGVVIRPARGEIAAVLPPASVERVGFQTHEALLPYGPRSFHGYRLLQEFFTFPQRYMFLAFTGLAEAIQRSGGDKIEILVPTDTLDLELENSVDASNFMLHCTPAINLFSHRADRIHLSEKRFEFHVVPDRTRPMDYEVYRLTRVTGYGTRPSDTRPFKSFYAVSDLEADEGGDGAFYVTHRVPRPAAQTQLRTGSRLTYLGSEVYLSLVDAKAAPFSENLRQLAVETLCTNRDLPLRMPVGRGKTDFTLDSAAPVKSLRCVSGPTAPRPSMAEGEFSWRLISHLSQNYLALLDDDPARSAKALRSILHLYVDASNPGLRKLVDAVTGVASRPVTRRILGRGEIAFARGTEIRLTLDEAGFAGTGPFLFGAVLERFLAKYASINSFTETVVDTIDRGEIMKWKPRVGLRDML